MKGIILTIGILLLLVSVVGFGYEIYVNYQYEKVIGSYFDNARDCITPDCILKQLNSGKQAIVDEGFVESDYGALIFKKPDNSMKFQFTHIDSIIERAEAVKEWKEQIGNSQQGEYMKDVYNEKMDNLRLYIHDEVRSDWIVKDSWYIKNHVLLYLYINVWLFLLGLNLVIAVIFYSSYCIYYQMEY